MGFLVNLIHFVFLVFNLLMFARILLSWINLDPYSPLVRTIHNLTEPILAPVRRVIPPVQGFDLRPLVVLIVAMVLEQILVTLVISLF